MDSKKKVIKMTNENVYEWNLMISSEKKQLSSNLFEIKSSPGLNFCISAEINSPSTFLKVKIMKTFTKSAIAIIELRVADMPPIIKDVAEWTDIVEFDKIQIPFGTDDCQKNNWNVCNLTAPDSHIYRIKILCSVIWYGFKDELLSPNLFEDMRKFWGNLLFSDIICCVKDIEIQAHKIVLASQSPFFAEKILALDSSENPEDRFIYLEGGYEIDVVNEMMTFLYYGKLEKAHDDYNIALQLFQAAGDCIIIKLKDVCGVILSNKITVDNVLILLELARKYNSVILKQRAMTFIINNRRLMFSKCF
ncbi:TD and POZ domain-containing protein 1-like [Cotesia typhae]|uniref:TD and POZ domain-containing protein 1-like n=1 Tax=Cotesia typhae TaxID=2053667 RepID=UPI003D69FE06